MFRLLSGILVVLTLVLSACGAGREETIAKIKELEGRLLKDSTNAKDEVAAYNLQVAYSDFSEKFPKDPEAPEYLFKAANLSIGLGWSESAITILDKLMTLYPEDKRSAEALFYKAFVYDNQINDDAKAGEVYREFLSKYPQHEFAASAQMSIESLGKSDEDLLREFEAKLAADSNAVASADTTK